ncbi:MAG: complex I NDUFA9 subunit family protein [Alphaproteobacteria bacterium]|nr:complex I NDUFA9 subunit family protein [Alphaproteobacteria bacterium]
MRIDNVTVFGGSGFLGRHLVRRLAQAGARVRVAVRDPEAAAFLKPMGDVGQVMPMAANLRHEASVRQAVAGADAVVNLVGILYQRGGQRFAAVHAQGARRVAAAAKAAGVRRLVHVSAIGADLASSAEYARSKALGELAVTEAFADASIVRPSLVFGPEDDFFNRFAALARLLPALPLLGGGTTRFQPVYVGDVAEAIHVILRRPETAGQIYELGGPRSYSFKELLQYVLKETGRNRLLLPLPFGLAKFQAAFLQLLPVPPLTPDQVELLRQDNVVSPGRPGLADLGIAPTPLEVIVPSYLFRFRRHGQLPAPHAN